MTNDSAKMTVKEAIAADSNELKTRCSILTDPLPRPFFPINTAKAAVNAIKSLKAKGKK